MHARTLINQAAAGEDFYNAWRAALVGRGGVHGGGACVCEGEPTDEAAKKAVEESVRGLSASQRSDAQASHLRRKSSMSSMFTSSSGSTGDAVALDYVLGGYGWEVGWVRA